MVQNVTCRRRGTTRLGRRAGGAVVEERAQPRLQYELRHRRLAAEARRAVRRARLGSVGLLSRFEGYVPDDSLDLIDATETLEHLDRDF
jgi:hypothetical protein